MNGLYGLNVRVLGVSRDQVMGDVVKLRPAFMLVHDDPALAALCASVGIRVIYRASGDDPQGNPLAQSPAVFVQTRADAAPTAAYIHLTNELDPSPALHKWTLEAMQYANKIGRKVCILNTATNKSREQYEACRANVVYARQHGHAVGIHIYEDGAHDDGAYDGWLTLKREVGGLWIVTEYAPIQTIFDANTGWRAFMSPDQVSVFAGKRVAWFANERMPVLWFSYDDWQPTDYGRAKGFGIWRENGLINRLAALNGIYKYREAEIPVPQTPTYPKPEDLGEPSEHVVTWVKNLYVNLRALPSASSADIGDVKAGDRVLARPLTWDGNGYKWARLERPAGWIASELLTLKPVDEVDAPKVKLDVPYVSQLGNDASAINNDCGEASALMLIQYNLKRRFMPVMRGLTVNMLVAGSDLRPRADVPKNADHIVSLLRDFAADGETVNNVTPDAIVKLLDAKRPVVALTTYDVVKPGDTFTGNHWIVLTGYGKRGFYGLDSYKANGEVYITTEDLQRGMKQAYASPLAVVLAA